MNGLDNPPVAERIKHTVFFGKKGKKRGPAHLLMDPPVTIDDYYYWIRDESMKDPKVLKYLNDESQYYQSFFNQPTVKKLNQEIFRELKENLVESYKGPEFPLGKLGFDSEYRFYTKFVKGGPYPIYSYRKEKENVEYLNINQILKGKGNFSSPTFNSDLNFFGYGVDKDGDEKYKLKIFTFPKMKKIKHEIPRIPFDQYLIYTHNLYYIQDYKMKVSKIFLYDLRTGENKLFYKSKYLGSSLGLRMSDDFTAIIYSEMTFSETESRVLFVEGERKGQDILVKRLKKNVIYQVEIWNEYFIILINERKCNNFCLKYAKIGSDRWSNLVEYDPEIYMESFSLIEDGLIVNCRSNGEQFFRILNLNSGQERVLKEWSGGYDLNLDYTHYRSSDIIYEYSDFITPQTFYQLNLLNNEQRLIYQMKTKNFNPQKYEVQRFFVGSSPIVIDILMLKGETKRENCLLYGYNSYGINIDVNFNRNIFTLVDRGFVYAICNTRGSSYLGMDYYKDGKLTKKINGYNDFIEASEFLIREGFSSPNGLSIYGRSAGGLLVTACAIMRPDLYRNVVAFVPYIDTLVSLSDPTIVLTFDSWEEWGNPNIRNFFNSIRKYSPIDNIQEGTRYPNFYITSGLHDSRVAYWEPVKFVAKLRYLGTDNVILKINRESGHLRDKDRYKNLRETSEYYTFLLINSN